MSLYSEGYISSPIVFVTIRPTKHLLLDSKTIVCRKARKTLRSLLHQRMSRGCSTNRTDIHGSIFNGRACPSWRFRETRSRLEKLGPYVSERAWGTVREHYDIDRSVWSSFPFAHAHKRGYEQYRIDYEPTESTSGLFGGNSNWRGPVWMPINYLMIESLRTYHEFWGEDYTIEYPVRSGKQGSLLEISDDRSERLTRLFKRDENGRRPFNGDEDLLSLREPLRR